MPPPAFSAFWQSAICAATALFADSISTVKTAAVIRTATASPTSAALTWRTRPLYARLARKHSRKLIRDGCCTSVSARFAGDAPGNRMPVST
jgi:hypothetical protein